MRIFNFLKREWRYRHLTFLWTLKALWILWNCAKSGHALFHKKSLRYSRKIFTGNKSFPPTTPNVILLDLSAKARGKPPTTCPRWPNSRAPGLFSKSHDRTKRLLAGWFKENEPFPENVAACCSWPLSLSLLSCQKKGYFRRMISENPLVLWLILWSGFSSVRKGAKPHDPNTATHMVVVGLTVKSDVNCRKVGLKIRKCYPC